MVQVTLNITGPELTVLYLLTGNEDAGRILFEAIRRERAFQIEHDLVHPRVRRKRRKADQQEQP